MKDTGQLSKNIRDGPEFQQGGGGSSRGTAERAGYYNLDASDGGGELGDITRREAVRWGVLPLGTRQLGAG